MVVLKKGDKVVALNTAFSVHEHGESVSIQIPRRSSSDDYAKIFDLGGEVESENLTGIWFRIPGMEVGNV